MTREALVTDPERDSKGARPETLARGQNLGYRQGVEDSSGCRAVPIRPRMQETYSGSVLISNRSRLNRASRTGLD